MQAGSEAGLSRGFLATELASRREKMLARIVVAVSLVGFVVGAPLVRVPLPRISCVHPGL